MKYRVDKNDDTGGYVVRDSDGYIVVTIGDGYDSANDSTAQNLAQRICDMLNKN